MSKRSEQYILKDDILHEKRNLPWRAAADTSKCICEDGAFLCQRICIGTPDLVISIHSQLHARIVGWNANLIINMDI